MEPELAMEIGTKFFAMYSGINDPQALEKYIQQIRLAFCFFFIMEIATIPDREKSGQDIIEKMLRGIVLPNADAIKYILSK